MCTTARGGHATLKRQVKSNTADERQTVSKGTVGWFDEAKGYGSIRPDGGGEDLFVHYTQIDGVGFRTLEEGAEVSYEAPRRGSGGGSSWARKVVRSVPEKRKDPTPSRTPITLRTEETHGVIDQRAHRRHRA